MERVIAYVDGFNLYYGLKAKKLERYLWLDIPALAGRLLRPNQQLVETHYFTARVSSPREKVRRQSIFLDALAARGSIVITEGRFQVIPKVCRYCGRSWDKIEEKRTDVNIATAMLTDAASNRLDTALLISGDSDLTGPVIALQQIFQKRVVVMFPPGRKSQELGGAATVSNPIFPKVIGQCLLPDPVVTSSGIHLSRPMSWN